MNRTPEQKFVQWFKDEYVGGWIDAHGNAGPSDPAALRKFCRLLREVKLAERDRCIEACRRAVPRAHTYASENADIYRAGDAARDRCIRAIMEDK